MAKEHHLRSLSFIDESRETQEFQTKNTNHTKNPALGEHNHMENVEVLRNRTKNIQNTFLPLLEQMKSMRISSLQRYNAIIPSLTAPSFKQDVQFLAEVEQNEGLNNPEIDETLHEIQSKGEYKMKCVSYQQ